MRDIESIIDFAERVCKSNGSRLTTKRKQVLTSLLKSNRALSAYDIASSYQGEFGTPILAMSVYRILDFLESEQLVHKLNLANKYVACSHITCKHEHGVPQFLICKDCSQVKEVSVSRTTFDSLQDCIEQAGYHLVTPQIEMNCVCQACATENLENAH